MRKSILIICILGANLSFIACTDDSLAEIQDEIDLYADDPEGGNGGEDGTMDPPPDPPGDGN